jgi:transposase
VAPAPNREFVNDSARVIPQSGAGPGLLAHILVSKFVAHLPLYRLEQIAARSGVELPRQKQCRRAEQCAHLLRTIHEQLEHSILASGHAQVDETPVKVLDADRGGKAAQSYLWSYHAPNDKMILRLQYLARPRQSRCVLPARLVGHFTVGWL